MQLLKRVSLRFKTHELAKGYGSYYIQPIFTNVPYVLPIENRRCRKEWGSLTSRARMNLK